MKVGILSGGGDAPGINAVIRASVRKAIQNYGASSFIRKPYNEKEMLSTIHDLIGGETKNDVEKEIEHSQLKAVPEEIKETEDIDIEKRLEETFSELKSDSLKKEKESEAGVEVDEMLKDALSELGLDAEEKKPLKLFEDLLGDFGKLWIAVSTF